jgi:hypothetical protein
MGITIQGERLKHAVVNPSYRVAVQARLRVGPTARFITVPATVPVPGVSVMVQGGVAGPALELVLQEASIPTPARATLPDDFYYTVVSCGGCRARPGVYCETCVYKGFVRKGKRKGGARWKNPKERHDSEISALEAAARSAVALARYGRAYGETLSAELGGVETGARPPQRGRGAVISALQRGSLAQTLGVLFNNKSAPFMRVLRASPPLYAALDPAASALVVLGAAYADTLSAELGGIETGARPPLKGRGAVNSALQRGSLAQALGVLFSNKPAHFMRVLRASPPLYAALDPAASALVVLGAAYADTLSAELGGVETGARPPEKGRGAFYSALQRGSLAAGLAKLIFVKPAHFMRVLRASPPLYAALDPASSALVVLGAAYADTLSAELGGVETGARPKQMGRGAVNSALQRGSLAQALGVLIYVKPAHFMRVLRASPQLYSSPLE